MGAVHERGEMGGDKVKKCFSAMFLDFNEIMRALAIKLIVLIRDANSCTLGE